MRSANGTVSTALLLSVAVLTGAPGMGHDTSARRAGNGFAGALLSSTRSPDIRENEDIYAPLEGEWEVETRDVLEDGSMVTGHGEWLFTRVLEGRAFQDVWILPSRVPGGPRPHHPRDRYGTSLRMMDPTTREWRVVWMNPVSGSLDVLWAHKEGETVVQEGTRPDGQRIRWIFDVLTPDRFHWYGESQQANGRWTREVEFSGRRRASRSG